MKILGLTNLTLVFCLHVQATIEINIFHISSATWYILHYDPNIRPRHNSCFIYKHPRLWLRAYISHLHQTDQAHLSITFSNGQLFEYWIIPGQQELITQIIQASGCILNNPWAHGFYPSIHP